MPDEDEKNLAAVPASDSVPPDAPTVVTEFPSHLIEALAQAGVTNPAAAKGGVTGAALAKAALAQRSAARRAVVPPSAPPDPRPAEGAAKPSSESSPPPSVPTATEPLQIPIFDAPNPIFDPQKTLEIPTAIELLDLHLANLSRANTPAVKADTATAKAEAPAAKVETPAVKAEEKTLRPPRPSFDDVVQTAVMESSALPILPSETSAGGSPTFPHLVEVEEEVELGEDQLEPYESPSEVAPFVAAAAQERPPDLAQSPAPGPIEEAPLSVAPTSSVAASFAARRAAMGYGEGKSGPVWAEPPPPAVLIDQPSALGWAIGGILGGVLVLALLAWLLYLGVRHFVS